MMSRKHKKKWTIVSWNVNSIRARIVDNETGKSKNKNRCIAENSALDKLVQKVNFDIICYQETKCTEETKNTIDTSGYYAYWNCCSIKKGYSGVSIWSKRKPIKVTSELPYLADRSNHLLNEGRILTAYYPNFILVNTYTPNTIRAGDSKNYTRPEIMMYRIDWDNAIHDYLRDLKTIKPVIWCGDMNVARQPIDNFRCQKITDVYTESPTDKLKKQVKAGNKYTESGGGAGYRLEERFAINKILDLGLVDIYRNKNPTNYGFTYWDMTRPQYRFSDYGMRIDYFIASRYILRKCIHIKIHKDITYDNGVIISDHAPIELSFKTKHA
jgi:exodeoxyribonuclease III